MDDCSSKFEYLSNQIIYIFPNDVSSQCMNQVEKMLENSSQNIDPSILSSCLGGVINEIYTNRAICRLAQRIIQYKSSVLNSQVLESVFKTMTEKMENNNAYWVARYIAQYSLNHINKDFVISVLPELKAGKPNAVNLHDFISEIFSKNNIQILPNSNKNKDTDNQNLAKNKESENTKQLKKKEQKDKYEIYKDENIFLNILYSNVSSIDSFNKILKCLDINKLFNDFFDCFIERSQENRIVHNLVLSILKNNYGEINEKNTLKFLYNFIKFRLMDFAEVILVNSKKHLDEHFLERLINDTIVKCCDDYCKKINKMGYDYHQIIQKMLEYFSPDEIVNKFFDNLIGYSKQKVVQDLLLKVVKSNFKKIKEENLNQYFCKFIDYNLFQCCEALMQESGKKINSNVIKHCIASLLLWENYSNRKMMIQKLFQYFVKNYGEEDLKNNSLLDRILNVISEKKS